MVVVAFASVVFPEAVSAASEVTPETESAPPIEAVPVAVRLASERSPEKSALPCTESDFAGVVVPMPMFPPAAIRKRSVLPPV